MLTASNTNIFGSAPYHAQEFQPLKPQLMEADLNDLFSYIWTRDTFSFDHTRYRLQVAFTILLIFHLGLQPRVALNEGLHYHDTTIFVTRHNNNIRALLVLRLENRDKKSR